MYVVIIYTGIKDKIFSKRCPKQYDVQPKQYAQGS